MPNANIIDLIFLLPAMFLIFRGFQNGILLELTTGIAIVIGVIGSLHLSEVLTEFIAPIFNHADYVPYISLAVAFLLLFFVIRYLGKLVEYLLQITQLNIVNRILGAVLGFAKICFLASLLFWLIDQFGWFESEVKLNSLSYNYLKDFAPWIIGELSNLIPYFEGIIDYIESNFDAWVGKEKN